MDSEIDIDVIKIKLKELVRQAAESRTRAHTQNDVFTLEDITDETKIGQILGNRMSLILITGEALKITLKLHFSHTDIKEVVYPLYQESSSDKISNRQSMDFVKELSNLTAGYLEKAFEEMGISLGISLPLGTRGYYEIFSDYTPSDHPIVKFSDLWCIKDDSIHIVGSVMIEISNTNALANIMNYESTATEEDDEGEFDFL